MNRYSIVFTLTTIAALLLAAVGRSPAQDEESRRHLLHELGGPFFVSRDPVQDDLRLSDEQKQKLRAKLSADVQEAVTVEALKSGEREPAMRALRQKSYPEIEKFLRENLTSEQFARFQQLKLQYDTPAIMLQPEIGKELAITDAQRQQFMGLIQEMQKAIVPLMKEAKSSGNPQEILPKVIKLRQECQAKIEGLLSDAQRTRWKEMIGRPLVIW
jgi:hypothetical protein